MSGDRERGEEKQHGSSVGGLYAGTRKRERGSGHGPETSRERGLAADATTPGRAKGEERRSAHLDALPALGVTGDHGGPHRGRFGIGPCVGASAARWAARLGPDDDARAWLSRAEALIDHGASTSIRLASYERVRSCVSARLCPAMRGTTR